jgi:hypothetical protein
MEMSFHKEIKTSYRCLGKACTKANDLDGIHKFEVFEQRSKGDMHEANKCHTWPIFEFLNF